MDGWLMSFMTGGKSKASSPPAAPLKGSAVTLAGKEIKETFDPDAYGEGVGFERWEDIRRGWNEQTAEVPPRNLKEKLDVDGISESLTNPSVPFKKPVHLPAMVGVLTEIWDEDGLYDN
eukprot:Rhum_TRINITY_DN691_c0_g1::Rhum_TRINITY_DN691_c0_g1_i1::g.2167::m.2167